MEKNDCVDGGDGVVGGFQGFSGVAMVNETLK